MPSINQNIMEIFLKKNIKITVILVLLSFVFESRAQNGFIIAGQHSSNNYFYQYTPDSTVINIPAGNYIADFYSLDINNDGTIDFEFELHSPTTAMGFQSYYCLISGINSNLIALLSYDTCYNYGGGYVNRHGMAFPFLLNDTIDSGVNWINEAYLNYSYQLGDSQDSQYYACGCPSWSSATFIGVRILEDTTYKYGWIRIAGTVFNPFDITTLTLGAFACENRGTGIKQTNSIGEQVKIYPNPASNTVHLTTGSLNLMGISITDMLGNEIIKTTERDCDVSNFQIGVYFVHIETSVGILTKKVIINR